MYIPPGFEERFNDQIDAQSCTQHDSDNSDHLRQVGVQSQQFGGLDLDRLGKK